MSKSLTTLKTLSSAESVFNRFKGIFAIYKPPDYDLYDVYKQLKYTLLNGINQLQNKPVEDIVKIDEEKNLIYLDKNLADTFEGIRIYYFF